MIRTKLASLGIEYRERENFTDLGGFLMACGSHCRVTMNAWLTDEEKQRGSDDLLAQFDIAAQQEGIYVWMREPSVAIHEREPHTQPTAHYHSRTLLAHPDLKNDSNQQLLADGYGR